MSKSYVFPYGIALREDAKISISPVAEVGFLNKEGDWLSLFLLIDSGATISALPRSDASVFGIDVEKGTPIIITGIGKESLAGWQHSVKIRFGQEVVSIPIVFLENDSAPRVLGRKGIFGYYTIIFEEKKGRSAFFGVSSREARSISKVIDKIST